MGGKLKEVNGPTDCVIRFTNGNIERNRFPKKEKINQIHFLRKKTDRVDNENERISLKKAKFAFNFLSSGLHQFRLELIVYSKLK